MRRIAIVTFLIFIVQYSAIAQVIRFDKDSLIIENDGFYDEIKDSLFIKNAGDEILIIDSIYASEYYSYPVTLNSVDTSYLFYIVFDNALAGIRISPQDSIELGFYVPDLCPICKYSSAIAFKDTIYLKNNSLNDSLAILYISGDGYASGVSNEVIQNQNFILKQNYPNPLNPTTTIEFYIPASSNVKLNVYNLLGQLITTLIDEELSAGNHKVIFDGSDYPSGVYFYEMTSGNYRSTKKFIYMK